MGSASDWLVELGCGHAGLRRQRKVLAVEYCRRCRTYQQVMSFALLRGPGSEDSARGGRDPEGEDPAR